MSTKRLFSLVAAIVMLCGCSHDGNTPLVNFAVKEAAGSQFKVYAYSYEGNDRLSTLFDDDVVRHDADSLTGATVWSTTHEHHWPGSDVIFYAYIPCDGVANVSSTHEVPLSLEYTTNPDPSLQGDLLFACKRSSAAIDSTVRLTFFHALSWLSFVWKADDPGDPNVKYKLHSLTVRAKQSGRMTMTATSVAPVWELMTRNGDYHFEVYECPDNDAPDEQQVFANPTDELLRHTRSLYLAPGVAVAADIEFSVWKNGELYDYMAAPNLILGGHEHTAAYIEYNTHYTYTFHPSADVTRPIDVRLQVEEWGAVPE